MKLHQHFEFGSASQDPFSFCQIQLTLDTVRYDNPVPTRILAPHRLFKNSNCGWHGYCHLITASWLAVILKWEHIVSPTVTLDDCHVTWSADPLLKFIISSHLHVALINQAVYHLMEYFFTCWPGCPSVTWPAAGVWLVLGFRGETAAEEPPCGGGEGDEVTEEPVEPPGNL